jgi:sugar lactone lactonase YvrE
MPWTIKRILNYAEQQPWGQGYAHYGFHDSRGNRYFFDYFHHWAGRLGQDDEFLWTAGVKPDVTTGFHMDADFVRPMFLTESPDGSLLISCDGNAKIFRLDLDARAVRLFVDAGALGLKDISSTLYDDEGNLWVSEVTGCRIWRLDPGGRVMETVGDGRPGFQAESVPFERARFRWIYVMKKGPDGSLYVLDSTNFAVRRIDVRGRTVETVAGTGRPGYTGDGGDARQATLGGNPNEQFDGPYGLCVDEQGNLFIADTCNHVVRMVEASTNVISTIAGRRAVVAHQRNDPRQINPLDLNLPKLSALDYHDGRLFIPEWDGDLIILERTRRNGVGE